MINNRYISYIILFVLSSFNSFSQSKKEQIEILTNRVDSLNRVLGSERDSNQNKINELNSGVTKLESQIAALSGNLTTLNKELQDSKDDILKKQKEIVENQRVISKLQSELKIKSDSLYLLFNNNLGFVIINYWDSINDYPCYDLGYRKIAESPILKIKTEYMHLEKIPYDDYEQYDIPKKAKTACGGWYAGTGDYFYSIEENGVIKIFYGWADEEQDEKGFHWEIFTEITE